MAAGGLLILLLFYLAPLGAQEEKGVVKSDGIGMPEYNTLPRGADGKPRPLSLEEAVKLVLKENVELKRQQLEVLKADTQLLKDESKYAPVLGLKYQGVEQTSKPTGSAIFQGTKLYNDTIAASISKLFASGTYFQVEISKNRFDSNAGEGPQYQGTILAQLADPPLHTGALKLVLRQELVKNAFGYSQRRLNQIARNASAMQRAQLVYSLSQLIVKTMIDYWSLAIAEENLDTAQVLLRNTRNIRTITYRKQRLGLAEPFEVNQWNALVAGAESRVAQATLERDVARRNILRTMNLDPELEITGATELLDKIPDNVDPEKDLDLAYNTRPDIKNLKLQKEIARMQLELTENARLPSVTIGGSLTHSDKARNPDASFHDVPSGKYHEYAVEFKVEYPLWDKGLKADERNARVSIRQLTIQERELHRKIRDEIREGQERLKVGFENLKRAEQTEAQTRAFYYGLLRRYRQGRFTAVAVKNALDALAQTRQALMQAKINFNISVVRYDLTRNAIFRNFNIDIDDTLSRMAKTN